MMKNCRRIVPNVAMINSSSPGSAGRGRERVAIDDKFWTSCMSNLVFLRVYRRKGHVLASATKRQTRTFRPTRCSVGYHPTQYRLTYVRRRANIIYIVSDDNRRSNRSEE